LIYGSERKRDFVDDVEVFSAFLGLAEERVHVEIHWLRPRYRYDGPILHPFPLRLLCRSHFFSRRGFVVFDFMFSRWDLILAIGSWLMSAFGILRAVGWPRGRRGRRDGGQGIGRKNRGHGTREGNAVK
jgi:hypothetical protein